MSNELNVPSQIEDQLKKAGIHLGLPRTGEYFHPRDEPHVFRKPLLILPFRQNEDVPRTEAEKTTILSTPPIVIMLAHAQVGNNGVYYFLNGMPVIEAVTLYSQLTQDMKSTLSAVIACHSYSNEDFSIKEEIGELNNLVYARGLARLITHPKRIVSEKSYPLIATSPDWHFPAKISVNR